MLFTLAFVAVCCSEEVIDAPTTSAKTGDEVQFTLSLDKESRTVYGDEDNDAFPIYWVEGDKVQIFSPQCLEGKRSAEYQVSVENETQNFATELSKTGENGLQWGEGTHDFYSLYPSGNYSLSQEGTQATGITINEMQNIVVEGTNVKSDMEDCLMYARTEAVSKGSVVNLQYDPISTVLMLTVKVAANEFGTDVDNFTIQSVTLEADAAIAGTFSLNISDGTFGEFEKNKSSKTIKADIVNTSTGGYHTISNGESFEIPIFLAPISSLEVQNWKISIVANNNTYTKTLNIGKALTPGQIHKITLPELKPATTEWDVATWMKYIPRNVYLSEVSIPGSWNSINPDFQTTETTDAATIAKQYSQGVRAFHLDTRWKAEYNTFLGLPSSLKQVIGLGVADGGANGSESSGTITSGLKFMRGDDVPLVEDIISQLVGYIKTTPDEYMVLVCSFAQESINYSGDNGYWYGEISAICNKTDYADYIVDASKLTPNTLVGDVLGKILVIVNMQEAITTSTVLPSSSKCMFTYMPSELESTRFSGSDEATLLKNNTDNLWYSSTAATTTGVTIYNNQAQITSSTGSGITHDRGYAPSMTERTNVLNTIVNWSKSNYGTTIYNHDKWIYLGLGGYQVSSGGNAGAVSDSYSKIASTYNSWINGKVTEMGTTPSGQSTIVPYYPVGIVLMNYVNDYASTVENILLLNNKYRLQYDPNQPSDYNPSALSVTNYSATATNGGNAIDAN